MPNKRLPSEFLDYLVNYSNGKLEDETRLPPLSDLSKEIGISVSGLREQMEVARAIGLVEVRPRTGIRRLPYTFLPAVRQSLTYAIAADWQYFLKFADLRNHIESAYWDEAVIKLEPEDHLTLRNLIEQAWNKLGGQPIQIPHQEHRLLHICLYSRLDNPFVEGLLEAYWEAYEGVGLNLYTELDYLKRVWSYHQTMVDAIIAGKFDDGYQALVSHKDLLFHRRSPELVSEKLNGTM
jgi:DNA-binding FadR family transcriptional regulator